MPHLTEAQKLEFTVLAQAAAAGRQSSVISEGTWRGDNPRITADLFSLELAAKVSAQPGQQAKAFRQALRAAASRNRLSEKQRLRRDEAVARKRKADVSAKLDVSCLTGPGGPWAELCWWKQPESWLPALLSEEQILTGVRMMRWGTIPAAVDHLLQFVGMEREARRRFCFRTGAAIRKAATDSTWRARQRGPEQKLPDPPQQPKGPAAALAGDRGSWVGPSVGPAAIRERQAYRHQANLASAVSTKQRTEAAVAEAARVIATTAATQAQGSFDRVLLVKGGGGRSIAAAGSARDNLANFDKQARQEASGPGPRYRAGGHGVMRGSTGPATGSPTWSGFQKEYAKHDTQAYNAVTRGFFQRMVFNGAKIAGFGTTRQILLIVTAAGFNPPR